MKKDKRAEGKYVYRFICALILITIATMAFFIVWRMFLSTLNPDVEKTKHLIRKSNLFMAGGIYFFLYTLIGTWMDAFKIGVERKSNVLISNILALIVTNFIEIFVSCAITEEIFYIWNFVGRYILLTIVVSIINCVVSIPMINLYRRIFPPFRLIEIRDGNDLDLNQKMNEVFYKYKVEGFLSCHESEEVFRERIREYDAVLIAEIPIEDRERVLKICFDENKRVYFVPSSADILVNSADGINLIDSPLFLNRNNGIRLWQRILKRLFDIVVSAVSIAVLSPTLFLYIRHSIKKEDGGPVFYRQERETIGGRHFYILKFRSMRVDAEKDGLPHPAEENDDRITKTGKWMRPHRFDELPQLFNVLKGDMSLVGPRPERVEHCQKYREELPEWDFRNKVRGGLTGYAQVYGKYNTTAADKLKMDLYYITHYSLRLDLKILFQTFKILLHKESTEGFSQERAEEMHDGNNNGQNQ